MTQQMLAKGIPPGSIAALLALATSVFMFAGGTNFCLDDAWIHLAYAKSLRLGDGLSYNPGDRATGFSSPLWVALLALLPWGELPILPVKLLGALCHAATAWGTAELASSSLRESPAAAAGASAAKEWGAVPALAAGAICATDPALAFAAVSGMEVPLAAALVVWSACASLRRSSVLAAGLAAAAVWARPESLFFLGAWSGLRWARSRLRSHVTLVPALAALAALGIWMAYCMVVSGQPFPNTYYVKRASEPGLGLLFFGLEYLPNHAWLVAASGAILLALVLRRPGEARLLVLAWLLASGAIAASRQLIPGSMFYSARYFVPLAAIPIAAMTGALPQRPRLLALALAPIALATLLLLPGARRLQRAQEHAIELLHTAPARWLASELPRDARLAAEGAGAPRFFLPRSIRVIDVVGLNFAAVALARDGKDRICAVVRAAPSHVLLPELYLPGFQQALALRPLRTFVDPAYSIVRGRPRQRVFAAQAGAIPEVVRRACERP